MPMHHGDSAFGVGAEKGNTDAKFCMPRLLWSSASTPGLAPEC